MVQEYAKTEREIDQAQQFIMDTLADYAGKPVSPDEVIEGARKRGAIKESMVRSAVWFLLDQDRISLTHDRKLVALSQP